MNTGRRDTLFQPMEISEPPDGSHGQHDIDWPLLLDNLAMTVMERIRAHQRAHEMIEKLREAVALKHGFDPDTGI